MFTKSLKQLLIFAFTIANFNSAFSALADMAVTKTAESQYVNIGGNITYHITVTNNGPDDAVNASFTDATPPNTTFVSITQNTGPAFSLTNPAVGGTGSIQGTIATLAAGISATFTVVLNVNEDTPDPSTIENEVTVTSETTDPDPNNNTAEVYVNVGGPPCPTLTVTKTGPDTVIAGQELTYNISVTNNGGNVSGNTLTLSDTTPTGTTFVFFTPPIGWNANTPSEGGTGTVTSTNAGPGDGSLPAGQTRNFTLIVKANPGATGQLTNTAIITPINALSGCPTFSGSKITNLIAQADLIVTKTTQATTAIPGQVLQYQISLANNGPSDAQNVVLTDQVPANTTFVSFFGSKGSIFVINAPPPGQSGTVTATAAVPFPAGAQESFTMIVNVNEDAPCGSNITNTVNVTSSTPAFSAADQRTDTVVVPTPACPPPPTNLRLTKIAPAIILSGSFLTYQLQVENISGTGIANVTVTDLIPAQTTFVSATDGGQFQPGPLPSVEFNFPLAAGQTRIVSFTVKVNNGAAGPIINTFVANNQAATPVITQAIPLICNLPS